MLEGTTRSRSFAVLFAIAATALLSACFLAPGRFDSSLDLRNDGQFTFTYDGEIHMLALSKLAQESGAADFQANPCYDDDSGVEYDCTASEIADQKKAWEQSEQERIDRKKREASQMSTVLGGIDPSDPKAADEIAERLRRQEGWKRVDYKGDGLFAVEFALTGTLSHDFTFPTLERFPMANPFVQLSLRQDGTVRLDAPALVSNPAGPMQMMAMGQMGSLNADTKGPALPKTSGTFTVTTDGTVLSNNTDQGPQTAVNGKTLRWTIGGASVGSAESAPMALIQLHR